MQLQMLSGEETVVELHHQTKLKSHQLQLRRLPWETLMSIWGESLKYSFIILTIRWLLKCSDTPPELTTAILLALGSVHDKKTIPLAYELQRKSPAAGDAVAAFLDTMSPNP